MLKGHPRGLYVAFFANMGERFGFYTMMAILVLFLQAKYGMSSERAGLFYGVFYTAIYALALVGGFIADRAKNYKGTIFVGIATMLAGYCLMAIPGLGLPLTVAGLVVIAFGNGLFKGNLQAVVGQLYDNQQYAPLRDSAYSIFYMGINVGAFFAPAAATGVRDWYLNRGGFAYNADLPGLCHQQLAGALKDPGQFQQLANSAAGEPVTDLTAFANEYIAAFSTGYHYAFGIAAGAMVVSLLIYVLFQSILPSVQKKVAGAAVTASEMPKSEERQRLVALGLVFLVVIFFWMSFHQNGLTLTLFARDYTVKTVDRFTNLFFDIKAFLAVIAAIFGAVMLVSPSSKAMVRAVGAALVAVGGSLAYYFYGSYADASVIAVEKFQHFNPIFIVFLTPVIVGWFAWMNRRKKEPSTPKKIGIGMILAALGFVVVAVAAFGLPSPASLAGQPSPERISPYWLMSTYFVLTIAELFLSPMGISFVSKVAPPRFQGLMQGGWLGATAIGNSFLFVGPILYERIAVWQVWAVFVVCCLASAGFVFSVMKRLERVTGA